MWQILEGLLYDNTIEEEHYRKIRQKSSSKSAVIVGLVAAVGGFLYGYDTGLINDLLEMQYVYENFPSNHQSFSSHERALITAILSLGTFVGALIAPLISDNYGRKFSIIISSGIIFNVGNILQIASSHVLLLCIGRGVSGIAVGILSAIVPLYQAEASPKWVRGSVVFTYQWAITWGLLIASAVCQGTRKMLNSGSYRIPIGLQFLWALILYCGMLFLPESPRYYVQKNDIQKALDSLSKLRRLPPDDADLIEELVEIKANYDYELSYGKTTLLDCFRNGGGRHKQILRMFTGIGVQVFQQCSGINFIFYYGVNFFSSTGIKNSYIMSFITYLVNTIFTIPGIILVDTIGRRQLLFWGGLGMTASNFIIAITGVTISSRETASILSISFSCVFIAFFASSWGGCTWALCSDIYGISIRQKAISITTATNWIVNFVFAYITPYLIDTGKHTAAIGNKIFFIWGGCNFLGTMFVYFTVYETKGLKLEEIDFMYAHCSNARESIEFKSTKIDYAKLDADYNLIPTSPNNSTINSTSSSPPDEDLSNEKSSYNNVHQRHHGNGNDDEDPPTGTATGNANNLTIIPYNNIISPSLSSDSELSSSESLLSQNHNLHGRRRRDSTTANRNNSSSKKSSISSSTGTNDYQTYLESLKSQYNSYTPPPPSTQPVQAHLTNQASTSGIKHNSMLSHTTNTNNSISNSSKIFTEKDLRSLNDEYNLIMKHNSNPTSISNIPTNITHITSGASGPTGTSLNRTGSLDGSGTESTTIIATPFFNQPPDSDSDDDSEGIVEEDELEDD
ncbi:Hgt4 glucose and galactose sensor [Scheffersomyces coipomensis]|uniref:Hgt4 glucose and galactose sensor n=1 Tax=Scheffersomyces coipomensis TaxID=1788519 RepID=UPI00315C6C30